MIPVPAVAAFMTQTALITRGPVNPKIADRTDLVPSTETVAAFRSPPAEVISDCGPVWLALSAVAGVLWYVLLWGLGALSFPVPDPPLVGGVVPVPFLLIVGGLALGLLLAALSRAFAGVGARRRASAVEARLREAIAAVADREITAPVAAVLARHRATREALNRARAV